MRRINFEEKPFKIDEHKKHLIVVLGYVLNEDGSMKVPLINRLKKCLEMYKLNPQSKIILSGGFPKAGRTESYMMRKWLLKEGVPA